MSKNTNHTEQTEAAARPGQEYRPEKLLLRLTPEEYNLMNWVRTNHRPSRLYQWAIDVLVAAACEEVRRANLAGERVPQGVNEIVAELRKP